MNILAAFAHPDDETIFIGGTIAMLTSMGVHLHIVSATRGEGGEVGEPPVCRRDELGLVRQGELECAVKALGANSHSFLDYVDPSVGAENEAQAFDTDPENLADQLIRLADAYQATALLTHGSNGEYGHPAHILMNRASKIAAIARKELSLYTISAAFDEHPRPRHANEDDPADFIFSIEPWFQQKLAAARCHRSQNALFVRRSSKEAGRKLMLKEVLMRSESLHYVRTSAVGTGTDAFATFILENCGYLISPS
jgi:LmbE family N-acetylglucosaminyl deacetylase